MVVSDGEKWVAIQNIIRFEAKLVEEKDREQRSVLRELIERERDKLRNRGADKRD